MTNYAAGWDEVWKFYRRHEESLRLTALGFSMEATMEDHRDILHGFVLERLPRAVAHSRDLTHAKAGRYVRASLRNYCRDAVRRGATQQRILTALESEAPKPTATPEDVAVDTEVLDVVASLAPDLARAVGDFLGLHGPPRSSREIAKSLGTSRYQAENYVIDGMAAVVLAFDLSAGLSQLDAKISRRFFLAEQSTTEITNEMKTTEAQVKGAIQRTRKLVQHALKRGRKNHDNDSAEHS